LKLNVICNFKGFGKPGGDSRRRTPKVGCAKYELLSLFSRIRNRSQDAAFQAWKPIRCLSIVRSILAVHLEQKVVNLSMGLSIGALIQPRKDFRIPKISILNVPT
jgi:hypothetical protein